MPVKVYIELLCCDAWERFVLWDSAVRVQCVRSLIFKIERSTLRSFRYFSIHCCSMQQWRADAGTHTAEWFVNKFIPGSYRTKQTHFVAVHLKEKKNRSLQYHLLISLVSSTVESEDQFQTLRLQNNLMSTMNWCSFRGVLAIMAAFGSTKT